MFTQYLYKKSLKLNLRRERGFWFSNKSSASTQCLVTA